MRIEPLKENTRDYITAGALGAIGGYSLKHYLPLSDYERSEVYTDAVKQKLVGIENGARKMEFDTIILGVKEGSEDIPADVLDVFVKNKDNIVKHDKKQLLNDISTYDDRIKEGVLKLAKRVKQSGVEAKEIENRSIEALAKSSRPTSYFVLLGTVILLTFAVLKNSLKKNMNN